MSAPIPRLIQVAVKAPTKVTDLIAHGKAVVTALTGNPYVPSPSPSLAVLQTQVSDLESAELIALTRVKGGVATRNVKKRELLNSLHVVKAGVQLAANADPPNAVTIINSAALAVRAAKVVHTKLDFAAQDGATSGSVKLVARASARRAAYDWQWSPDQKAWTSVPSTLQAHTIVVGLQAGATVSFRYRTVTKSGTSDWGQIASIVVK